MDLSQAGLRAQRMHAQLLAGPPAPDVLSVVERVVGIQAQAAPPARLAVRVRTRGLTAADVDRAVASGTVVRTWAMRGTLHMIATADLGWLTALLGPVFLRAGRRRREALGLDEATCERALPMIGSVLAGAPPTSRAGLVERLSAEGLRLDPGSQAPAHLVGYAALHGLICRGPELPGDEPSIVLTAEWTRGVAQRGLTGDAALCELARRFLLGYGPAGAVDLAAWSGLPARTAQRAFELFNDGDALLNDGDSPTGGWDAAAEGAALSSRLLGQFDTYLLGYRGRDFAVDPVEAKRVNAGGGMIAATVLVNGAVAGVWRRTGRKVRIESFGRLPAKVREEVENEVADLARFTGMDRFDHVFG